MKDEIKEILDKLDKIKTFGYNPDIINSFCYRDLITLLDYITNLQKENERFKAMWKDTNVIIKDDKTLVMNTNTYNCLEDYKARCEKAIEYIENGLNAFEKIEDKEFISNRMIDIECFNDLLNILQGVGKDE